MLTARLIDLFEKTATDDWPWFETILSYDNAKLPHALLASGRGAGNAKALEIGLRSLRWLVDQQKAPQGHFRPIGSNGFYRKGQERAQFDQQPLEAHATISACLEAYWATDNADWLWEARNAFEWFLGRNDLGLEVYDTNTGGCNDGLSEDRINQNQGAESTLVFLLSLAEMELLGSAQASFRLMSDGENGIDGQNGSKVRALPDGR